MSAFLPNTPIRVEHDNGTAPATGTHVDGYGPDVSNWTPTATGVPAYLYEDSQTTWDPSAGRMTRREVTVVRLRPGTPVEDRDRLVDERSGLIYQVDTISAPLAVVDSPDLRVVMIRVTG